MGESEEATDTLDQLLRTAFTGNVTALLRLLIQQLGSWWIVAHLCDLLHHCGSVESYRLE
jgi:Nup85 Nucleoporin